ncbi:MAG TPA: phosphoribosyltransferase family protein [Acidimicrobiales bacterium]|nr:phosphoribosyltransferase family protein [Acidimicrobiales bacterium]
MTFVDRADAGRQLAAKLAHLRSSNVVVLGLPRGGVPVAAEVARALAAPLDVIVVRKLGAPRQPELGMGAIGEDGVRVINDEVVRIVGASALDVADVERHERAELDRRARRFRAGRARLDIAGRTVVIVDDGIATGSTARAACQVARAHGAARVVLAVPVAPPEWESMLGGVADEFVCLETPASFFAVGQAYVDFSQTGDDDVVAILERARERVTAGPPDGAVNDAVERDVDVVVVAGGVRLRGHLHVPAHALSVVLFAHGSGSSRLSPRNQYVAGVLNDAGLATLLFDLLDEDEARDRANVFDIALLATRLSGATEWLRQEGGVARLPIAYFGASTGAAAALWAAADRGSQIAAVVSRGGRPDLADARLGDVVAPTLLIVGGADEEVLELNRWAQARLRCENRLEVVPGATHLFDEPGTLEAAARAARDWFLGHAASSTVR